MNSTGTTVPQADVTHPSSEQLNAFVLGQLDDDDVYTAIERHLSACSVCCQILQTNVEDSLVVLARRGKDTPVPFDSTPNVPATQSWRPPRGYEMLEKLGEGGMGMVWKARQTGLGRLVALKRIRSTESTSAEALLRFRREAKAAARMQHANIVQIYEIGEQDGEPYLVLEYVEGGSLAQRLADGPLPPDRAAALVETLARAMHHAHAQGIIHRDLKPANVLLASGGRPPAAVESKAKGQESVGLRPSLAHSIPKITDFGLAKRLDEDTRLTHTNAILGTPSYMAPEQCGNNSAAVGELADVYALGAILYETLTGRPPFRGPSVMDTLEQVRQRDPVPPRELQPKVPRDLQTICLKCLEKEPRRRYTSAEELADDLRRFRAGEPIRARPIGRLERSFKWMRRKPVWATLAGCAVAAVVLLIGGAMWHDRRLRAQVVRAENAETRTRQQYRDARDLSKRILGRLGDLKPTRVPGERELFAGVLDDALAFHRDTLQRADDPDPEVRADVANVLYQIGLLQSHLGQNDNADHNFREAAQLYEQLTVEAPDRLDYSQELSNCYNALGCIQPNEDAVSWCQKALELRQEIVRRQPEDAAAAASLAQGHLNLGVRLLLLQRRSEAEEQLHRAVDAAKKVVAERPDLIGCRATLADAYVNLGLIYQQTDRKDPRFNQRRRQADEFYQEAERLLQPLMRDYPHHSEFFVSFAAVCVNRGNLQLETAGVASALKVYDRGIEAIESLLRRDSTHPIARENAFKLHATRGQLYHGQQRYADAVQEWDRVLELAQDADRPRYRMWRALSLLQRGDSDGAAAEAERLTAEPNASPDTLYNAACIYAQSRRAEKAIALLNKLRESGYFDKADRLKSLDTDSDFDSLRRRDDFAQLLNSLYGKTNHGTSRP